MQAGGSHNGRADDNVNSTGRMNKASILRNLKNGCRFNGRLSMREAWVYEYHLGEKEGRPYL